MSAADLARPRPLVAGRHAGRVAAAVLLIVFAASLARNLGERGDFQGYLEVGELVLQGRDIYADARPGVSTWPPFFAVLCVPLALVARASVLAARALWLLLNGAVVVAILHLTMRLVYGHRLALDDRRAGVWIASTAVLGPLVLAARFVLGNLDRLQINMIILWGCLLGGWLLVRGRPIRGGAVIGLMAAIKVLPVFLLPYLAWKRWWRALAAAVVTGAACSALPVLVFGPERFAGYVRRWLEIAGGGWPVRKGNQSLYAMIDRFSSHADELGSPAVHRLVASDDPRVAAAVYGAMALVAVTLVAVGRRGGRRPESPAVPVEIAIVLVAAVLFSPLAWKHYFVFLLPAYAVLWRAAFAPVVAAGAPAAGGAAYAALDAAARRRLRWVLATAFALTTLTVRGIVGKPLGVAFESLSAVTAGGLVVLGGALYLRALLGAAEPAR